jgi:hypothetical protein
MIPKTLDAVTYADIEMLVAQQVREGRTIEFKRESVGPRDEDKREFLADVSAFANTLGGDILYGVAEVGGVATELCPLALSDTDVEIRRLEDILRSGLEPRLPRCDVRWVHNEQGAGAILVRIPRSWAAPHRVIFREHSKFYARNSAGKYPLDVAELRAAFNASETLITRLQQFRRERNSIIESDEGAVPLNSGAKLIFHILPISAFSNPITITPNEATLFCPIRASGFNYLHTLEGFATYSGPEEVERSRTYTLVFRNGIVEAAAHVGLENEQGNFVYPYSIEGGLLEVVDSYFKNLQRLGVEPPFYVSIALLGVRGYVLATQNHFYYAARRPLRRDTLVFPEVLSEVPNPTPNLLLRPIFDLLWQAFGYQKSPSFDEQGQYVGNR